jgi:hypothetical protein
MTTHRCKCKSQPRHRPCRNSDAGSHKWPPGVNKNDENLESAKYKTVNDKDEKGISRVPMNTDTPWKPGTSRRADRTSEWTTVRWRWDESRLGRKKQSSWTVQTLHSTRNCPRRCNPPLSAWSTDKPLTQERRWLVAHDDSPSATQEGMQTKATIYKQKQPKIVRFR